MRQPACEPSSTLRNCLWLASVYFQLLLSSFCPRHGHDEYRLGQSRQFLLHQCGPPDAVRSARASGGFQQWTQPHGKSSEQTAQRAYLVEEAHRSERNHRRVLPQCSRRYSRVPASLLIQCPACQLPSPSSRRALHLFAACAGRHDIRARSVGCLLTVYNDRRRVQRLVLSECRLLQFRPQQSSPGPKS